MGRGDKRVWRLWFWRNGCPRFALGSAVLARFALGSCPALRFCRGFALSSRPAFRFYLCVLPLARVQGLRFCWGVLHSAHTRLSVSAAVLSLAHPVCVILPRCFALGTCPALRFWRNCLPSAHAQHCGSSATVCPRHASGACVSVGAFCLGSRLLFAAWRQTGRLAMCCVSIPPGRDRHLCVLEVLARLSGLAETRSWSARRCAFRRGVLPSVHARPHDSVAAFCPQFMPSFAFLSQRFAFGSRLLFAAWRQTGRLAMCCVSIPQVEIAICAFSKCWRGYLPWWVHFGFGRFFVAISTGYRGTEERGTENGAGGAAFVRFCASTLAL